MQLYALGHEGAILASHAEKGKDYLCPECQATVRIRGGPSRQVHFYHLALPAKCRQHEKSEEHIQLQHKLLELFGPANAQVECPFPAVRRIADVAWHAKKIIFEIQCSPISLEEVQCRLLDYQLAGYQVIWVLHDKRFNRKNLSAAESFLRTTPCYFTNADKAGSGIIYDQFEVIKKEKRIFKGPRLAVSLDKLTRLPVMSPPTTTLPQTVQLRFTQWKCYMEGDLLDRLLKEGNLSHSSKKMLEIENRRSKREKAQEEKLPIPRLVAKGYRSFFNFLLKKFSDRNSAR